jgi:hypothetical protein
VWTDGSRNAHRKLATGIESFALFRFMEEKGGCEEKIGTPKEADLH